MKNEDYGNLIESIKEAGLIKRAAKQPSRTFNVNPPLIRNVRHRLHVSQSEFALMIGVSIRTLQNWEQGRRKPDGPAKALLKVASTRPRLVLEALLAT